MIVSNIEKVKFLFDRLGLLEEYKSKSNFIDTTKQLIYDDLLPISDYLYNKVVSINSSIKKGVIRGEKYISYLIEYIGDFKYMKFELSIRCIEDDYYYVIINDGYDNCYYKLDQVGELINFLKILFRGYEG